MPTKKNQKQVGKYRYNTETTVREGAEAAAEQ